MNPVAGAAGSSTHRLPRQSHTTLCTQTKCPSGASSSCRTFRHAFQLSSGYGRSVPSGSSSATEIAVSSLHRGKFTKMRPSSATVTPVT